MLKHLFLSVLSIMASCLCGYANGHRTANAQDLFYTGCNASAQNVSCYRIPAIEICDRLIIIAAADERVPSCGDLKWNENINIVIRRSMDGGRSWTEAQRIVDFPDGESASDPSMIYDKATGTLFLFYNYMNHKTASDKYFFHVIRSMDGGITWSEPQDITSQIAPQGWADDFKFITSGHGVTTSDNRLLHTIVNLQNGLHIFGSDDHGTSWYLLPAALTPADESKIITLEDGTWIVNSRVQDAGYRYLHFSKDNGTNWTSLPCEQLPDPGCNGAVETFKYRDKEYILFVNTADPEHRRNLTLKYSTDNGTTWSAGYTIHKGEAAYSDIAVTPDGDIVILYERDNYAAISATIIPFSAVLDTSHK